MDRIDAIDAAAAGRRQDRDPVPLQHVPADRDRRAGVQVRRRVGDQLAGGRPRAGRGARGVTHAIVLIQAERIGAGDARRRARGHRGRRRGVLGDGRVGFRRGAAPARARTARAGRDRADLAARGRACGRRRWSRSRSTRATTWRRCSPSGSDRGLLVGRAVGGRPALWLGGLVVGRWRGWAVGRAAVVGPWGGLAVGRAVSAAGRPGPGRRPSRALPDRDTGR